MNKSLSLLLLTLILLVSAPRAAHAQAYIDYPQTTGFIGVAMPAPAMNGVATSGVAAGIRQVIPIQKHLCLVASVDYFNNRQSPSVRQPFVEKGYSYIDTPTYTNIPIMGHLHLGTRIDRHSNLKLWTDGAIGANMRFISPENAHIANTFMANDGTNDFNLKQECDIHTRYDRRVTFASQWGLGITLFRRYSIAMTWYYLGRASVTGTTTISDITTTTTLADGNAYIPLTEPTIPAVATPGVHNFDQGKLRTRFRVVRFGFTF